MCLRNQRPETSSKSLEKKFIALKRRTLNTTLNCIDFKGYITFTHNSSEDSGNSSSLV